jgi:hypothetical protein
VNIKDTPDSSGHALRIGNAGLVLLSPYLPMLFERLELLATDDGQPRITDGEPLSRAVHLLQYCVDARLDRPEPELTLNKLLCGQPTAQPVARSITAAQADLDVCDQMLQAVVANWHVLRETSLASLRETFLRREGQLRLGDNRWKLRVQRKTLDVMTDQIPWNVSVIDHPWMIDPIHVTW